MSFDTRLKYLRVALNLFGFFFLVVLAPLILGLWPSGWTWGVDQGYSHYALMIIAMYAVLGGFLLLAARKPQAYSAIIWYTVWSSVLHGVVMAGTSLYRSRGGGTFFGRYTGTLYCRNCARLSHATQR